MVVGWRRTSFALISLALLLAGLATAVAGATRSSAHHVPAQTHTIEIGNQFYEFNPPACVIHRKDNVRWRNVSDEPRRIVIPGAGGRSGWERGNPPVFDSRILQPGALSHPSGPWAVNAQTVDYFDPTHPEIPDQSFRVSDGGDECGQVTPTPTPTPSPTPTPPATPSPELNILVVPNATRGELE